MWLPLQAACTNLYCNHFSFVFIITLKRASSAARQGIRQDNRQEQVNDMTADQRANLDQKKAENQDNIDNQRDKAQGRKDNARAEADRFKVCKQH